MLGEHDIAAPHLGELPRTSRDKAPRLEQGRVLEAAGGRWLVATGAGLLRAEQAVSCLVRPLPGDTVLLALTAAAEATEPEAYVLAVLARPDHAAQGTDLEVQGSLRVHVSQGDLQCSCDGDLNLCAGQRAELAAGTLGVQAGRADLAADKLSLRARLLRLEAASLRSVAGTVQQVCRRLTQRLGEAVRFVAGREEVQAGELRMVVEETLSLQSKNAVHLSEEIVKIDAGQVHLG